MSTEAARAGSDELLSELAEAVRRAKARPREIEVGVALSVALGKLRGPVSCGGCQVPLEFEGIPARTNVHLKVPFRLIGDEPAS